MSPVTLFLQILMLELFSAEAKFGYPRLAGKVLAAVVHISGDFLESNDPVKVCRQYVDWSYKVGKEPPFFVTQYQIPHPITGEVPSANESVTPTDEL